MLILLDSNGSVLPELQDVSRLRTSDRRSYGGCVCGWSRSSFVDDACL